jgi:hypothetical protein
MEDKNNKIKTKIKGIQAYRQINHHIVINNLCNHISKANSKHNQIALIMLTIKKNSFNTNPIICPKRYRIRSNGYVVNLGGSTIFWTR